MAVFYISGLTLIVGTVFYVVFGSGEIQPWAMHNENEEEGENKGGTEEKEHLLSKSDENDLQQSSCDGDIDKSNESTTDEGR